MSNNDDTIAIPPDLVENIRTLLRRRPIVGYDVAEIGRLYFSEHKTFVFPERYGMHSWKEVLSAPEFLPFCEFFNSGLSVRWRRPSTTSSAGSSNGKNENVSKYEPPSTAGSSASSDTSSGKRSKDSKKMDNMDIESCSDSTEVSDVTHVSITPHNQTRLAKEQNKVPWIPREAGLVPMSFSTLILERGIGPETPAMYIDCTYCDRGILEQLMDIKGVIKRVNADKFAAVRNKYNEFEFERGAIFQHGAAIKLANIDALMGGALTNPKGPDGANLIGPNELLYFADLYGGPGGCAEYVLWKKKWQAKGFGISPRGKMDYNLAQAEHFPRESFEAYYGESGIEGTGDIMRPFNMAKFAQFVRESTGGRGVHFVIASGGDRNDYVDEDQKEIRCKYIFMAELLCALQTVRQGGHYVTRIYDMYTPFTVGLLYLMYRTFDQIAVFKPEASLPASAERYIFCKWRKSDFQIKEISNYLSECHKMDWLTKRNRRSYNNDEPADIVHLVARERIKDSYGFCQYMLRTNNDLGRRQFQETRALLHRIQHGDEGRYVETRLREIQDMCQDLWGIPKSTRQKPKYSRATTAFIRAQKLILPYSFDFFEKSEENVIELTKESMVEEITQPKEWQFMPIGTFRGYFLCLGGSSVYQFVDGKWNEVNEKIELMNNTLVYADLVDEMRINGSNQTIKTGLHIIDALVLGGTDIRDFPANERYDLISKYAKSMNKASREDLATIRVKQQYELKYFSKFMAKLHESERIRTRNGDAGSKFLVPVILHQDEGLVYCPAGILLMKTFKQNFAPADTRFCLSNRLFWRWTNDTDLKVPTDTTSANEDIDDEMDEDRKLLVSTADILRHINIA